jgi:carbohydrate-binding DOMON domain-containing protein
MKKIGRLFVITLSFLCFISVAMAGEITFKDPKGDDKGPGNYIYPTDGVYKPGSFDLREFKVGQSGSKIDFSVDVGAKLEDPWGMGCGFAIQMVFIFIDIDGKPNSGHTEGLPGLNIKFDPKNAWDKVVILSPQKASRVNQEAKNKVAELAADIVVPNNTSGSGKTIKGKIDMKDLGQGDPLKWKYQVVVQSNEGFPAKTDFLMRKVNEFEGQHRFGGGNDMDCDPHVIDILAGAGAGTDDEIKLQQDMLSYQCDDEGKAVKQATLTMVGK